MHAPLVLPAPQSLKEEVPLPPRPKPNPFQPLIDLASAMSAAVSMAYVLPYLPDRHGRKTRDGNRDENY